MSGIGLLFILILGLPIWFFVLLGRTAIKRPEVPWRAHLRKLAPEWCLWLGLSGVVALSLPIVTPGREASRRVSCVNNLKQIGLALHNYQQAYGCLPPAYTTDKQGRPLHSWRVLVLPYLERGRLYDRLRLDEPWDSEHNREVAEQACPHGVPEYRCPSERDGRVMDTSYVMLVGPGTISDRGSCTRLKEIADGTPNTVVVAEMARSGIHWMEPRDLNVGEMSWKLNDFDSPAVRSDHPGLANVLLASGAVHTLREEEIDPEGLRGLTTIAGGEDVKRIVDRW